MNESQFIKSNSKVWERLEKYSLRINKKGIKALPSKEVKEFLNIFRISSHHLAYARTHYPESSVTSYLNALISKSHNQVYAVKRISPYSAVKYFAWEFPKRIVEYKWFVISSFGVFAAGFILSLLLVLYRESNSALFLPQSLVNSVKQGRSGGGAWNYPLMSSYIMINNITIALKAFVMGITLGIGTIYVLFSNGALVGALTAIIYMYGNPVNYWSLILPHGVLELTAVFISGGAGLIIAEHILIPGEYSRRDALINGAKKAVSLIMGIVVMLVIAGIIEGFFTPLKIPEYIKLSFAALSAVILAVYFSIPVLKDRIAHK